VSFEVVDLGRTPWVDALKIQEAARNVVFEGGPETLFLVEHEPILTLGASFHAENLPHPNSFYEEMGISILPTDRGGDVTYHAPGQLVIYPIFDISKHGKDLHKWMRDLEEAVMIAIKNVKVFGERLDVNSGVWVNHKKICAVGTKVRRWVSMHGLALNCDVDLAPFSTFVPCGIATHGVTSLSQELNRVVTVGEMKPLIIEGFREVFHA
jgi:lipoyl(octanoyl) transferase